MRVGVLPIGHPGWPLRVIAFGNLANPVGRIAGAHGNRARRLAFGKQPQDLVPATLVRFFGCPVAPLELVDRQMRFQANVSWHASILQHLRHNWYYLCRACMSRWRASADGSSSVIMFSLEPGRRRF